MLKKSGIKIFIFFIIAVNITISNAQTRISSPYSAFLLGEDYQAKSQQTIMMGGLHNGFKSNLYVNYQNPASYLAFDTMSFVFEISGIALFHKTSTADAVQKYKYANFGAMKFGFPVAKWISGSFGLIPYSKRGYLINNTVNRSIGGKIKYEYQGAGEFNKAYIGTAIALTKKLAFGANLNYIFGSMEDNQSVSFPDSSDFISSRKRVILQPHDIDFNFGLQYTTKLFNNDVTIGVTGNAPSKIKTKQNTLIEAYNISTYGYDNVLDTIKNEKVNDDITIPTYISAGFTFAKDDKWLLGMDASWKNWENFSSFGKKDSSLSNCFGIAIGGYYQPQSITKQYLKKIKYYGGFRYQQLPYVIKNTQINEFGISFGFGFPLKAVRYSKSFVNVGFEVGKRGTTKNGLIKESFTNIFLSMQLWERWFEKRKYD